MKDVSNVCSIYNYPQKARCIWNDIKHVHIPYSLLFKCLIESNEIDTRFQIIEHYINKINPSQIQTNIFKTLLDECGTHSQLQIIYELWQEENDILCR